MICAVAPTLEFGLVGSLEPRAGNLESGFTWLLSSWSHKIKPKLGIAVGQSRDAPSVGRRIAPARRQSRASKEFPSPVEDLARANLANLRLRFGQLLGQHNPARDGGHAHYA